MSVFQKITLNRFLNHDNLTCKKATFYRPVLGCVVLHKHVRKKFVKVTSSLEPYKFG